MISKNNFFDGFFAYTAAVVAVLTFIDWFIGKEGKKKIKDSLEAFWLRLEDWQPKTSIIKIGKKLITGINYIFASGLPLRFKIFRYFLVFSLIPILLAWIILVPELNAAYHHLWFWLSNVAIVALYFSFFTAIGAIFSIRLTLYFLKRLIASESIPMIFFLTLVSLLVSIILLVTSCVVTYYAMTAIPAFIENILPKMENTNMEAEQFVNVSLGVLLVVCGAVSLFVILPVLVTLFLISGVLIFRLLYPIFKPIISTMTLRFYESEKGVLTQISLGLGVAAKVIQELIKNG